MFARLAHGEPRFREWLQAELAGEQERLIHQVDGVQLRVAQGRAQALTAILDLMETCGAKTPGY